MAVKQGHGQWQFIMALRSLSPISRCYSCRCRRRPRLVILFFFLIHRRFPSGLSRIPHSLYILAFGTFRRYEGYLIIPSAYRGRRTRTGTLRRALAVYLLQHDRDSRLRIVRLPPFPRLSHARLR